MSKISYRYGTMADTQAILDLCGGWWKDSSFYKNTGMEYVPDVAMFQGLYDNGQLFILVGESTEGKVVACYLAAISPYMFNPEYIMASEIVWSIRKDYRKGREVFRLLSAIEKSLKASKIDIYNLNLPILEGKDNLMKYLTLKKGYFIQDKNLMKELN